MAARVFTWHRSLLQISNTCTLIQKNVRNALSLAHGISSIVFDDKQLEMYHQAHNFVMHCRFI